MSGSNPLLKVAIAIVKEITTIAKTAIMFVNIKTRVNLRNTLLNESLCARNDTKAYTRNIISDAAQVARIHGRCFLIEENTGSTNPKTSFVVAVDPTTEPTSPTVSINAGYTV